MSGVFVHGLGAVSPAGWGVPALQAALQAGQPLPTSPLARPGWERALITRPVPPPSVRPAFLTHPRLRRASSIAQHTVAAALEALGEEAARVQAGSVRLGVVICLMAGCVTYSRRFCEEVFCNPATASPVIFPETVFNAPGSHLAAYLGCNGRNYTLVGDEGTFIQGLALAAEWLQDGVADGCVVVGGEELDWVVGDALRLFRQHGIHSSGAGAVYLRADGPGEAIAELACVTDAFPFLTQRDRVTAVEKTRSQLLARRSGSSGGDVNELLCLGMQRIGRNAGAELAVWRNWTGSRIAPWEILGEAFAASAAWQCVAACAALRSGTHAAANVGVVGVNQQAIGVRFVRPGCTPIP